MLDALCAVIRETGASDSASAARVGVHPSTVSRWKRDCPDVAIVLRAAREDFRDAHLAVIFAEAQAGRATSMARCAPRGYKHSRRSLCSGILCGTAFGREI
jgi:hypothetical protein